MENSVKVTVYRWVGEKWFLRIEGECLECDLAVSQVRTLVTRNPIWPIELEIKPWLNHLWDSLQHGGWHAPVVLVDAKLVKQGRIPTLAELEVVVERALESRGIAGRRPGGSNSGTKECCARGLSPCKSFPLERELKAGSKN